MDLARVAAHRHHERGGVDGDAAVLVPVLSRGGEPHLLFTKRADHLGEHPGQMSFPGGRREPGDADRRATALREAEEEVDLDPADATVVGRLDDITTVSGYAVSPFVAVVPDREYVPHEAEVAEIAVLRVAALLDPGNYESEHRVHPEFGEVLVDYFHVDGFTVWGATGRILGQFLELACGWEPPDEYAGETDVVP